jgi:hypothetical protein
MAYSLSDDCGRALRIRIPSRGNHQAVHPPTETGTLVTLQDWSTLPKDEAPMKSAERRTRRSVGGMYVQRGYTR